MKRFPHPRRECACESSRAGASQARYCKKVPEKGDENYILKILNIKILYRIAKRSPRKGTKTCPEHLTNERGTQIIAKRSPRKGTKTFLVVHPMLNTTFYCKKVPEKGDENHPIVTSYARGAAYCKKVPEKGDENFHSPPIPCGTYYCKKVPEKGDENIVMCISEQCLYFILKKGPRERGRKQLDAFYFLPVVVSVIEKSPQERGRNPHSELLGLR